MNKLRTSLLVLMSVVMFLSSGVVFAQRNERPYLQCQDNFKAMDTDGDGRVSMQEFRAVKHRRGNADKIFKSRDANKDGFLTMEEFCSDKGRGTGQGKGRKR